MDAREWCRLLQSEDLVRNTSCAHFSDGQVYVVQRSASGKVRCSSAGSAVTVREVDGYIMIQMGQNEPQSFDVRAPDLGKGRGPIVADDVTAAWYDREWKKREGLPPRGMSAISSRGASASSTRPHTPFTSHFPSRGNSALSRAGDGLPPRRSSGSKSSEKRANGSTKRPQSGAMPVVRPVSGTPIRMTRPQSVASAVQKQDKPVLVTNRPRSAVPMLQSPSRRPRSGLAHNDMAVQGQRPAQRLFSADKASSSSVSSMKLDDLDTSSKRQRQRPRTALSVISPNQRIAPSLMESTGVRKGLTELRGSVSAGSVAQSLGKARSLSRFSPSIPSIGLQSVTERNDDDRLLYDEDEDVSEDENVEQESQGRTGNRGSHRTDTHAIMRGNQTSNDSVGTSVSTTKGVLRPPSTSGIRPQSGSSVSFANHDPHSNLGEPSDTSERRLGWNKGHGTELEDNMGGIQGDELDAISLGNGGELYHDSSPPSEGSRPNSGASGYMRESRAAVRGSQQNVNYKAGAADYRVANHQTEKALEKEIEKRKQMFDKMIVSESTQVWALQKKISKVETKTQSVQDEIRKAMDDLSAKKKAMSNVLAELDSLHQEHEDAENRAFAVGQNIKARAEERKAPSTLLEHEHMQEKRLAADLGVKIKDLEAKSRGMESKIAGLDKNIEAMSSRIKASSTQAEKLSKQHSQLKEVLKRAKSSIAKQQFDVDLTGLPEHLLELYSELKSRIKESEWHQLQKIAQKELEGSSDGSDVEQEQERSNVTEPGWGEKKWGEGWKTPASVIRKAILATRAPSPRWAQREFATMSAWAKDVEDIEKYKREERKKEKKLKGVADSTNSEEVAKDAKDQVRRPATEELWSKVSAANFQESYFDQLSGEVAARWRQEFFERINIEQNKMKKGVDLHALWRAQGIPSDKEADRQRLEGISAELMEPEEHITIEMMRKQIRKKCKNFDKLFDSMDADKDGVIDATAFLQGCENIKVQYSAYQIVSAFMIASGGENILTVDEVKLWFSPPRPTRDNIQCLQKVFPFLLLESDEVVESLLLQMGSVPVKRGTCIYSVGHLEDWMFIIEEGTVDLRLPDGSVLHKQESDTFGLAEALPRATSDVMMRRDTAYATSDCILWKLSKQDLDAVVGNDAKLKHAFYCLDEVYEATHRSFSMPPDKLKGKVWTSSYRSSEASLPASMYSAETPESTSQLPRQLAGKWSEYHREPGPWDALVVSTSIPIGRSNKVPEARAKREDVDGSCARMSSDKIIDFRCKSIVSTKARLKVAKRASNARFERARALGLRCRQLVESIV